MNQKIWSFRTKRFLVEVIAQPEDFLDISWDESGEVAEGLESGELCAFTAKARVIFCGDSEIELGNDYLGNCIYKSPKEFRDHLGVRPYERKLSAESGHDVTVCRYFSSMVRQAIAEARNNADLIAANASLWARNN